MSLVGRLVSLCGQAECSMCLARIVEEHELEFLIEQLNMPPHLIGEGRRGFLSKRYIVFYKAPLRKVLRNFLKRKEASCRSTEK